MKTATLIATIAAGTIFAAPAAADHHKTEGEAELAKLIEGRVAGEPQSCVQMAPSTRMRVIDGTAIVVERGSTVYVNIPRDAEALDDGDAMAIRRTGSQLCRMDMITTFDRMGGFYTGNIFLGDFVPYKKVEG
ncbi:hypothetical protein [Pelagerythrobacter marensis]|uniref:Uncharacterized protein n=1 Tax=Pelagerythrobacter marensis TaxID=543877 RepID=A0A0G3XDY5_9SPHN|nr:hypothetical protein [Pelagerythrobacter marensis]AKM08563.1 hypothetical protein AM2010_2508 [Pelagerythrobacter marensis]